jgi:hypothetical protein
MFGLNWAPCAACQGRGAIPVAEVVTNLGLLGNAAHNGLKYLQAVHRSRSTSRKNLQAAHQLQYIRGFIRR